MPTEIKLWSIEDNRPKPVSQDNLDLEARLEDWIRDDIGLVNDDLLVIGQQVPTDHTGEIDLLAMDSEANLVILELKRDRTPRDIVAQILDYASYVQKSGLSEIREIAANAEFSEGKSLEDSFDEKFGYDLPEFVNQAHRMYIVASSLDSATERIVGYLSETHGVDINVATFAYFHSNGQEMIGRSMLLDEGSVQTRAETRRTSKRRPNRTLEELRGIAEDNGVADLWDKAYEAFLPLSQSRGRSQSTLYFNVHIDGSTGVFVSLSPVHSSREDGLAISLSPGRIFQAFNISEEDIRVECDLSESLALIGVGTSGVAYSFDADRLDNLIELFKWGDKRNADAKD